MSKSHVTFPSLVLGKVMMLGYQWWNKKEVKEDKMEEIVENDKCAWCGKDITKEHTVVAFIDSGEVTHEECKEEFKNSRGLI